LKAEHLAARMVGSLAALKGQKKAGRSVYVSDVHWAVRWVNSSEPHWAEQWGNLMAVRTAATLGYS